MVVLKYIVVNKKFTLTNISILLMLDNLVEGTAMHQDVIQYENFLSHQTNSTIKLIINVQCYGN